MLNWKTILAHHAANPPDPRITIREVQPPIPTDLVIRSGIAEPKIDANNDLRIELVIDSTLSDDLKTTILFHEIGHAIDFLAHETDTIQPLNGVLTLTEQDARQQRTELAAFKHSLNELLAVAQNGWELPLRNTVLRIARRARADSNRNYREAIGQLMQTQLWQDCVNAMHH